LSYLFDKDFFFVFLLSFGIVDVLELTELSSEESELELGNFEDWFVLLEEF